MTADDVRRRVKDIAPRIAQGDSNADRAERDLFFDVLLAIAEGQCDDAAELAKVALDETSDIWVQL